MDRSEGERVIANPQDCISRGIMRSRGEDASLQALKDARFVREALADAGWALTRWDTGEPAPPLDAPWDEWSATPGKDLTPDLGLADAILRKMAEFPDDWTIDADAKTASLERNHFAVTDEEAAYLLRLGAGRQ